VSKVVKKVKNVVKKVTGSVAKAVGLKDEPKAQAAAVPDQVAAVTPAQSVEVAKEDVDEEADNRSSQRKAARARGKRGLSVSRSAGSGLNI
jgi:hypothetical protein